MARTNIIEAHAVHPHIGHMDGHIRQNSIAIKILAVIIEVLDVLANLNSLNFEVESICFFEQIQPNKLS